MSTAAQSLNTAQKILHDACARNTPLEISHTRLQTGKDIIARTRLLGMNDDAVLIDALQYRDDGDRIVVNSPVDAYFALNGKRYGFKSCILRVGVKIELNAELRLRGVALAPPETVKEVQRRNHFRVSLAGAGNHPVTIGRAHDKVSDACPIDGFVGTGLLINLSASGMALQVERKDLAKVQEGDLFYLSFGLRGFGEPVCTLSRVCHAARNPANDTWRLGIAFQPWGGADFQHDQGRIMRALAELQRRSLRRKKG